MCSSTAKPVHQFINQSISQYLFAVAAPDHKIRQCIQRSALLPGRAEQDAGGAKLRSAERVGSGEIRGSSGYAPRKKFAKINFEIAYFLQFCKLKWSHRQCWQGL